MNTCPTTTHPTAMTAADWTALLGCIITLLVRNDVRGMNYTITGTLATLRPNTGQVVLENATRTRLSGVAAGEAHTIARRAVNLVDVEWVASLGF